MKFSITNPLDNISQDTIPKSKFHIDGTTNNKLIIIFHKWKKEKEEEQKPNIVMHLLCIKIQEMCTRTLISL